MLALTVAACLCLCCCRGREEMRVASISAAEDAKLTERDADEREDEWRVPKRSRVAMDDGDGDEVWREVRRPYAHANSVLRMCKGAHDPSALTPAIPLSLVRSCRGSCAGGISS